jgi:hypothetical protein
MVVYIDIPLSPNTSTPPPCIIDEKLEILTAVKNTEKVV